MDWYDNGVSSVGAYDLCGNVWEWCASPGGAADADSRWRVHGARQPGHTFDLDRAGADLRRDDVGFRTVLALEAMLELLSI